MQAADGTLRRGAGLSTYAIAKERARMESVAMADIDLSDASDEGNEQQEHDSDVSEDDALPADDDEFRRSSVAPSTMGGSAMSAKPRTRFPAVRDKPLKPLIIPFGDSSASAAPPPPPACTCRVLYVFCVVCLFLCLDCVIVYRYVLIAFVCADYENEYTMDEVPEVKKDSTSKQQLPLRSYQLTRCLCVGLSGSLCWAIIPIMLGMGSFAATVVCILVLSYNRTLSTSWWFALPYDIIVRCFMLVCLWVCRSH